jgi:hypothetical protein
MAHTPFKGTRGVPEAQPGFAIKSIKPKKMFKNLAQLTRIPCSTPETFFLTVYFSLPITSPPVS